MAGTIAPILARLALGVVLLLFSVPAAAAAPRETEVIVELEALPLAGARGIAVRERALAVDRAQRRLEARLRTAIPGARVSWRYRHVLAGLAVVLPAGRAAELARLREVAAVYPSLTYRPASEASPGEIGAPSLWGPGLTGSVGRGLKIGIIDDGIDPSHPFFDPTGFAPPPGFPKGDTRFTTGKVIVARAFAPPGTRWRNARKPFDPVLSTHGTHVAGIAAGDAGTVVPATPDRPGTTLSGVAPLAYLGNYKALSVPTDSGLGLNGNSPEIVAAIEAAVADGMDVINLSLAEPAVPLARDAVAKALDNAAAAGVVPVVAAGNEYASFGAGSVSSPGSAPGALTVAAAGGGRIAGFSSGGPTPIGLGFKPDVAAPGVGVLSAATDRADPFGYLSGTSMAAPHVAGAAALLKERHPEWSVSELKSALVTTGRPLRAADGAEVASVREGGGLVDLPAADQPLLFASPQTLSFGLVDVRAGPRSVDRNLVLTDAGGGAGPWDVAVAAQGPGGGAVVAPASVDVPGTLRLTVRAGAQAREGNRSGFVVLSRGGSTRRVPFWFRVTRPRLAREPAQSLSSPGTYAATTSGAPALVDRYRYPAAGGPARAILAGPERVFRTTIRRPVANFGVAVVAQGRGVHVEPRIVFGADENRLAGIPALPFVGNPYLARFFEPEPVSAALLPAPGRYSIVFDSPSSAVAGAFRFRFWIDDTTPPRVTLLDRRGRVLRVRVSDSGSGVDPRGVSYAIDGGELAAARYDARTAIATIRLPAARPGRHRLRIRASDRQEAKNDENVARLLPNTRVLETSIVVP